MDGFTIPQAPRLETERLVLRAFHPDDMEAFAAMCAEEKFIRYIGGKVLSYEESWRRFAEIFGHWALKGFGQFAIEEKATGALIGQCGPYQPEGWPGFEIGWALAPEKWKQGFATEAASAAMGYAFVRLNQSEVLHIISTRNLASIKVAERLGAKLLRREVIDGSPVLIYSTSMADWLRTHPA